MIDRLDSASMLKENHKSESMKQKTVNVKNIVGKNVATNQAMYSYLRAIEEIAAVNPQIKIYNLCSHGAQIDNVVPLGSANELMKFLTYHSWFFRHTTIIIPKKYYFWRANHEHSK